MARVQPNFRPGATVTRALVTVYQALLAAIARLDKSFNPKDTITRLRRHQFTWSDSIYLFHLASVAFWLPLMQVPGYPTKLLIPVLFTIALLVPFTSQFFLPAIPVFAWLLMYYTSQFIPVSWRPTISVSLLPTLESVLFGANISDILTRFTHPVLDIVAWLPYGINHFAFPFVVAAFTWLFRTKEVLQLWARVFGYFNYVGVLIQILLPCAAPWYEIIHGLTPANYGMHGSPGGLLRIDRLFGGHGYTVTFSNAPVVFGAFPSLHAGCATLEALFVSHFFPQATRYVWAYAGLMYWATMYLSHHYLIDVVGGGCLAVFFFYLYLPDEFRNPSNATAQPSNLSTRGTSPRSKYDAYDLEAPLRGSNLRRQMMVDAAEFDLSDGSQASDEEDVDIAYRSPLPQGMNSKQSSQTGRGGKRTGGGGKSHRHTASIARLIREGERGPEEAWNNSPIGATFFDAGGDVESGHGKR
ncbi:acidPPc domain-containing protein [Mycena indigotica]|uniref:AcidPPc domain-containing protein n=1 Tax=Mycena indigotica TaxID=2126181 RepID=A0A8H6VSR4_9AGAR|nr:acidPPc domain-containing protein [Mycena indigotica]KAF7290596.1 acidPPc domain-containing protein [Mycena indigotica]